MTTDAVAPHVYFAEAAGIDGSVRVLGVHACGVPAVDVAAVRTVLTHELEGSGRPLFLYEIASRITVLLSGDTDAEGCRELLVGLPPAIRSRLRVGLSAAQPVAEVANASRQAHVAAAAASEGAAVLDFGEIAGGQVLVSSPCREVLRVLGESTLGRVDDYDRVNRTALLPTLRALLEANGHNESAAAVLGIHRHTLRTRIARIERILECSLASAYVRAELLLSLIVCDYPRRPAP
ncbi:PucR family transcriptional regulator [Rhodococcus sp. NPDC059968]|uniref:PucR family transcriptional regulator n=1 Tax=Rhodococcus sp. NPDC059968 TaxID=3347017 RepID=UPI0036705C67